MKKGELAHSERRRYVRLQIKETISVDFKVVTRAEGEKAIINRQVKTRDVSGGGMFLEVPLLKPKLLEGLLQETHRLFLEINIPAISHPIKALAKVVWVEGRNPEKYGVGVSFLSINEEDRDKLVSYLIKKWIQE